MGLRSGASYAKGFWSRLNGSPTEPGEPSSAVLSALPRPTKSDREQRASSIGILSQSIDALEKRLQDTSKVGCWPLPCCCCCLWCALSVAGAADAHCPRWPANLKPCSSSNEDESKGGRAAVLCAAA